MLKQLPLLICLVLSPLFAGERVQLAKGQLLRMDAPVAGFIVAGGVQVLPVLGLPGLVQLGEPIELGATYEKLAVAPGENYALAILQGPELVFLRLDVPGATVIARIRPDLPSIDDLVFSPMGSSVALRSANGQVAVLTSLPDAPRIAQTSGGARQVQAVSDDGELVVVVGESEVRLRARTGAQTSLGRISAAAFFPRNQKLLTVSSEGTMSLVENGAMQTILTSSNTAGVRELLISDSGREAWLATQARLWWLDLESWALRAELVEPGSRALHRTRVGGRVLLVDAASGEAQLVSGTVEELQVDTLRSPLPQGN